MNLRFFWFLALLGLALGCSAPPAQEAVPADPDVLAVYQGGEVTTEDLDRLILELPMDQRALADKDVAAWYEELARQVIIDRLLLEAAELDGLASDPEVASKLTEASRQLALKAFLIRQDAPAEPISEAAVQERYDASRERFVLPAARRVRHLFRRRSSQKTSEQLRAEMAELRARLVAGESFRQLAMENSDSESRHQGGDLGMLLKGQLPPQLERVIFSLPQDVPSTPIVTAEGVHLFLVEKAQLARTFVFEEVRLLLQRELSIERQSGILKDLVRELPPSSAETTMADAEQLQGLLDAGDPSAIVLRVGEFQETLAGLLLRVRGGQELAPDPQVLATLIVQLEHRERVYRQALSEGWLSEPELVQDWQQIQERLLVSEQRRRSLEQALDHEADLLRGYYNDNALRFSTPLLLRLRILLVPLEDPAAGNRAMARLEALVEESQTSFDEVAAELGGRVEDLEWLPFASLAKALPSAAPLAADLEPGGRSAPFRGARELAILEVLERREPEPEPFASVLDQVRLAYLENHGPELYKRWSEQRLAAVGWRLLEDRIQSLAHQKPEIWAEE